MHALTADFDIPDIVGRQLNQVGVGKWDVQFCFDCTRIIQSMGKVEIAVAGKSTIVFDREWIDMSPIQKIVGLDVSAWARLSDYSFSVTLTDGSTITFHCSDSQYEEIIVQPETWVF
jgi:hypothetical protein